MLAEQLRWPRPAALALLGLVACHSTIELGPSVDDPALRSAILIFEEEGQIRASALDTPGGALRPTSSSEQAKITVLFFDHELGRLVLTPGPLSLTSGDHSRPLPRHKFAFVGAVSGGYLDWTALDPLPPSIAALRIPNPELEACIGAGGCIEAGQSTPECKAPCNPPAAPEPPNAPLPP